MKLTIVTPSYNQGKFIKDTFNSILKQNLNFEIEYILVDALSTDETPKIVEEFIPKFKLKKINFIYIREKDNGQSDAINKGWKLATGDIFTYLNSDDFYEPNILNKVMDFFKNNPYTEWAYGGWNFVNKNGKTYKQVQPKKFNKSKLLNYCNIGQPSCFFRKRLLDELGTLNKNLHLTMDYDLWLRFSVKYNPAILPFVISNMRYHEDAKSGSKTLQQLVESTKLNTSYTNFFSWRRIFQYFYFIRGLIVILLKVDITKRINIKK